MNHVIIEVFSTTIRITVSDHWDLKTLGWLKSIEQRDNITAVWDNNNQSYAIPITYFAEAEETLKRFHDSVEVRGAKTIPDEGVVYRVGYIGACKRRPTNDPRYMMMCRDCGGAGTYRGTYLTCTACGGSGVDSSRSFDVGLFASAWVEGGWNLVFPEDVLRAYFPPTPAKFDGNFYKALLASEDLSKSYKQLARRFHPDAKGGSHAMFVKLREAYDSLQDPQRRKRYLAGMKFQQDKQEEIGFRILKSCGDVRILGEIRDIAGYSKYNRTTTKKLHAKKILEWKDITDPLGRVMTSTWKGNSFNPPFEISWEYTGGFEVDV